MAVSLRVPEEVKKRIAKLARQQDLTPHGFMLDAIRRKWKLRRFGWRFMQRPNAGWRG